MKILDLKLTRDLRRIWAQSLAIALVMAAGVSVLILAFGASRSLYETRAAYYDRYRFADIFAVAKRAPDYLKTEISRINGVSAVQTRIISSSLLDVPGLARPATGQILSLPKTGPPVLNGLFMRTGRLPDPDREDEIIVNESFATANKLTVGSQIKAILNNRKRKLVIVGIALSPEFIYALGPGDLVPDDRRFGIIWMTYAAAAAAYDLDGAFNSVTLTMRRGASDEEIISRLDRLLEPYGGRGAYPRKDHNSHAFIDAELKQLQAMAFVIPPIFLAVAAFLINMVMGRLIVMEREQIGLFKAVGYSNASIVAHYVKFVIMIAAVGVIIGFAGGIWMGRGLTHLYGDFFHFPFLVFRNSADVFVIASLVSVAAAILGAVRSVASTVALSPAVAMSPPAPPRFRRIFAERFGFFRQLPQSLKMVYRHISRWPLRAAFTTLGISLSTALLVLSSFGEDSIDFMIDVTYFQTFRQDAMVEFVEFKPKRIREEFAGIPGVLVREPHRNVATTIRFGNRKKRIAITGFETGADLRKILTPDLQSMALPESGIVLTEALARQLKAGRGDYVDLEIMEGRRRNLRIPVAGLSQGYLGLGAYMHLDTLNRHLGDGDVISGVSLALDSKHKDTFYSSMKVLPGVGAISFLKDSLANFRETLAENLLIMLAVYLILAITITFGVVYNSARIQLSERGRELASLRVLGFTQAEVSRIFLSELAVLVLLAIPLGCFIGYWFTYSMIANLESDLYRIPFVIKTETYGEAALITLAAAFVSAMIVRRRIYNLDLISVLKTRE